MIDRYRIVIASEFTVKTIISYGLIVYAKDTGRWLMIRRKHSVEFLLIVKGSYRISYLATMISNLTQEEISEIYKCISDISYFKELYYKIQGYESVYTQSEIIFLKNKEFLKILLDNLKVINKHPKWTWPKGRLNSFTDKSEKENPYTCALREFGEEVEEILPSPSHVSNVYFQEYYKTYISGWNLENRYWLYVVDKEFSISQPSENIEVSKRKWCSYTQCQKYLPVNNVFQREVIKYMKRNKIL